MTDHSELVTRCREQERLASEMAEMTHDAQPEAEADWLALAAVLHDAADALEREDQRRCETCKHMLGAGVEREAQQ